MKTLNALINSGVANEQLPLNLEKASKIMKFREMAIVISYFFATVFVSINGLFAIYFCSLFTDESIIETIRNPFVSRLSENINNLLGGFISSLPVRCIVLCVILLIVLPAIGSLVVFFIFDLIGHIVVDKNTTSTANDISKGFRKISVIIKCQKSGIEYTIKTLQIVVPALICVIAEFFYFKDVLEKEISKNTGYIVSAIILLLIFSILCRLILLLAAPVRYLPINLGIDKYQFDRLWLEKDPGEKRSRELAAERKRKEEEKYNATHAKIRVHFRCSRSDYRAIVKDNGKFLFNLKPGQTKTADVSVGEHYITSQVVDDYEGDRGNVNGGSVYLGPGEIQDLEVTA